MENVVNNFYRNFYRVTNGYIPVKPLKGILFPGDFFQITKGKIIVLGNIFWDNIISPGEATLDYHVRLNPVNWNFSNGVSKAYTGRGGGNDPIAGEFEYSKQILAFKERGSFAFHSKDPETTRITNWEELKQPLIIRLTQTMRSFRELYIVTESVRSQHWSLAISGAENAEMEIAGESDNFEHTDFFGNNFVKTIQSRDIEIYHRENSRQPCFFKAKKLVVKEEKTETFINDLINRKYLQNEWAGSFYDFGYEGISDYSPHTNVYGHANILDMLPANELNPNTALLYFRWADATLDDVEKLCIDYV